MINGDESGEIFVSIGSIHFCQYGKWCGDYISRNMFLVLGLLQEVLISNYFVLLIMCCHVLCGFWCERDNMQLGLDEILVGLVRTVSVLVFRQINGFLHHNSSHFARGDKSVRRGQNPNRI